MLGFENPIAIKPLQQVYQLYTQQHPDVKISAEITAYGTYIQELATQIAGGNAPDLITTNLELIPEYAGRHALLNLDQLPKGAIDLSDFSKPAIDANRVNGVLYGIPRDLAAPTIIYNATMFEKAGVKAPDQLWTWDEFAQTSTAISKAMGKGIYGTEDSSSSTYNGFEFWLRPKGKVWVNDQGKLGFEPQDLTDWLKFWADLRAAGGAPPGAVQAQETSTATSLLVTGKAAMFTTLTPQLASAAAAMHDQLGLHLPPSGFSKADLQPRNFAFGGASDSISIRTQHPTQAAQVIAFLLTDPKASQLYFASGNRVPCAAGPRQRLKQQMQSNHYVSMVIDYVDTIVQTPVKVANQGTNALGQLMTRTAQSVSTGQATIATAVNTFFAQAKSLT